MTNTVTNHGLSTKLTVRNALDITAEINQIIFKIIKITNLPLNVLL